MKRYRLLASLLAMLLFCSCNVHEWPDSPGTVGVCLRLKYSTGMTYWNHNYDGTSVTEVSTGPEYDSRVDYGRIRYKVRACPVTSKQRASAENVYEYEYSRDVYGGYDELIDLELPAGDYHIMVWSDLTVGSGSSYYDATDFGEIRLTGEHAGNNDHRDAFRGTTTVNLSTSVNERTPDTLDIAMERPLAKYEFVTTDVQEFIDNELEYLAREAASRGEVSPSRVNTEDYRVVFYYTGFMPNAYSIYIDKPVDSETGILFESSLELLSDTEASLGFDYVLVNGSDASVSVQIGLYSNDGRQIALSSPIDVPLLRNRHTRLTGSFLMQQASGGISINSDFSGNHNVVIE